LTWFLKPGVLPAFSVWVTFKPGHMVIRLQDYLDVPPGTTIDGRGARVEIVGKGLNLVNKRSIILTHLSIHVS
jgi:hypothetical protein